MTVYQTTAAYLGCSVRVGVWRNGPNLIIKYIIYSFNLVAKSQKKRKIVDVRLHEITPDAAVTNSN